MFFLTGLVIKCNKKQYLKVVETDLVVFFKRDLDKTGENRTVKV